MMMTSAKSVVRALWFRRRDRSRRENSTWLDRRLMLFKVRLRDVLLLVLQVGLHVNVGGYLQVSLRVLRFAWVFLSPRNK